MGLVASAGRVSALLRRGVVSSAVWKDSWLGEAEKNDGGVGNGGGRVASPLILSTNDSDDE
jgi:hypothetical protein